MPAAVSEEIRKKFTTALSVHRRHSSMRCASWQGPPHELELHSEDGSLVHPTELDLAAIISEGRVITWGDV